MSPAEAAVQRQLDAYNAHDSKRFVAEYTDDVRVFRPPEPEPVLAGKPASSPSTLREEPLQPARASRPPREPHGVGQHRRRPGGHHRPAGRTPQCGRGVRRRRRPHQDGLVLLALRRRPWPSSPRPSYPPASRCPPALVDPEFVLRMLSVDHVVQDYDAVMTSVEHLKASGRLGCGPEGADPAAEPRRPRLAREGVSAAPVVRLHRAEPSTRRAWSAASTSTRAARRGTMPPCTWARQSSPPAWKSGCTRRAPAGCRAAVRGAGVSGRDVSWDEWRAKLGQAALGLEFQPIVHARMRLMGGWRFSASS